MALTGFFKRVKGSLCTQTSPADAVTPSSPSNAGTSAPKAKGDGEWEVVVVKEPSSLGPSVQALLGNGPTVDSLPEVATKGISLRALRRLMKIVAEFHAEQGAALFGPDHVLSELTSTELVQAWVKPKTASTKCRLCELTEFIAPEEVGIPDYFVSYAWQNPISLLVQVVEDFLNNASEDTRVWVDFIAVNQHDDHPLHQNYDDVHAFETVLKNCLNGTIVVIDVNRCNPATRAWCIYEWDHTLEHHGPDGLHMMLRSTDRSAMFHALDVEKAQCYNAEDKVMILKKVVEHHGSAANFNSALKRQLLLEPLSYRVDLQLLTGRSRGTAWDFSEVDSWLRTTDGSSRALCVLAGAGTGKSTIAAALCDWITDARSDVAALAFHFLKYNDRRRLEPVRIMKTLTFQLANKFPDMEAGLFGLDVGKVAEVSDVDQAFQLLLAEPMQAVSQPVVLLIDALDEADPPEQQRPGFSGSVLACGNDTLKLLRNHLVRLPPNVRFIFTSRPDAVCGGVQGAIERTFPQTKFLVPEQLVKPQEPTAQDEANAATAGMLVYRTVVRECFKDGAQPPPVTGDAGGLATLYATYEAVFERAFAGYTAEEASAVNRLVQVLMAAQEPLPHSLLQRMGLDNAMKVLPGTPTLFFLQEHHAYTLHKSLADWLLDPAVSKHYAVDVAAGHLSLGLELVKDRATPNPYTLKYLVLHLSNNQAAADVLDETLQDLLFLGKIFRAGYGGNLVRALGTISYTSNLSYEVLRWLRMWQVVIEKDGDLPVTALYCPIRTAAYRLGIETVKPRYAVTRVLHWDNWPAFEFLFKGNNSENQAVAFCPDGRQFASCNNNRTVYVWDLGTSVCRAVLQGHSKRRVTGVAYAPDGMHLASSGEDGEVCIWDVASGDCTTRLSAGAYGGVTSIIYAKSGVHIIGITSSGTVLVWNTDSKDVIASYVQVSSDSLRSVAMSPDARTLACGGADGIVYLLHLALPAPPSSSEGLALLHAAAAAPAKALSGHTAAVQCVAFSPDGHTVASASIDKTIILWDVKHRKQHAVLRFHTRPINGVAYSPDGKQLASCGGDNIICLWDTHTCKQTAILQGHSNVNNGLVYSPDGARVACASDDNTVRVWSLSSPDIGPSLRGHNSVVRSMMYNADGTRLVTGSDDCSVIVWDLEAHKEEAVLPGHDKAVTGVTYAAWPRGGGGSAYGCAVSSSDDGTLRVWAPSGEGSWECALVVSGACSSCNCVLALQGGRMVAAGCGASVRFLDMATLAFVDAFEANCGNVLALARRSDGGQMAAGGSDRTISLWDLTWSEGDALAPPIHQFKAALRGHTDAVTCLAYHPGDAQLASGSNDNTVRLWDVATGSCTQVLEGHTNWLSVLVYSPDGKRLYSGARDWKIRVWRLRGSGGGTASLEVVIHGHQSYVRSMAMRPDGTQLASGGNDVNVRLWAWTEPEDDDDDGGNE